MGRVWGRAAGDQITGLCGVVAHADALRGSSKAKGGESRRECASGCSPASNCCMRRTRGQQWVWEPEPVAVHRRMSGHAPAQPAAAPAPVLPMMPAQISMAVHAANVAAAVMLTAASAVPSLQLTCCRLRGVRGPVSEAPNVRPRGRWLPWRRHAGCGSGCHCQPPICCHHQCNHGLCSASRGWMKVVQVAGAVWWC